MVVELAPFHSDPSQFLSSANWLAVDRFSTDPPPLQLGRQVFFERRFHTVFTASSSFEKFF
jgi:hypothetical protein